MLGISHRDWTFSRFFFGTAEGTVLVTSVRTLATVGSRFKETSFYGIF